MAVAVITGAAGGIGRAVAIELAKREVGGLALVDQSEGVRDVTEMANEINGPTHCGPLHRRRDGRQLSKRRVRGREGQIWEGQHLCADGRDPRPAGGEIRQGEQALTIYPIELFRLVTEINLIAPVYWALEMVGGIAEDRAQRGLKRWDPAEPLQGTVVFIGSVSSLGNKGQIAYAATKSGLEGAAATLMMESIFHGVRCSIIHPGYTDTPLVRTLGQPMIDEHIIPNTQLRRLIQPEEIADAICFMISNAAVSGSLWADAGWHPRA